ncbi:phosphatidylinositol-specific phospholipase C domain-containing protein [Pedobacter hiemivivus]|uniref:1-phosphatidylinositol phosphodiesterase n=1 Tax=Pedobacter hiemivivus TaxID=2530454 RepID=A0A4R0MH53_9SPHI|nr:phosphatidylinositol-specific phospholipase C domain-containing protein [Pedobacter hiemivivus]TCC85851.1 phosphatidylinositol-specific phospholipase C domain-containing protein [Pedobacter hiemivivus]
MGQGGHLLLKNKTPYRWKLTHKHSYQMKYWDNSFPSIIEPGSFAHVYIEWTEGTKNKKDDAGEIDYVMEGINASFQIQARAKNGFEINILFKNFHTNQIGNGETIRLGWSHNNSLVFMIAGSNGQFTSLGSRQNANKWMINLNDNKKLNEITIPGSHDTCTYDMSLVNYGYLLNLINIIPTVDPFSLLLKGAISLGGSLAVNRVVAFSQCQEMNLRKQLDRGLRFLDIRLKKEENHLQAYHGGIKIPMTFSQITQTCYEFLKLNSSETIIMSIQNEGDGNKPIGVLVKSEIDANKEKWYVDSSIPRLGNGTNKEDARGKLVLLRRYAQQADETKIGINISDIWPQNTQKENLVNSDNQLFSIQDEYQDYILNKLDHKFLNHVRPFLKETANTLFINFTSGIGTTGGFVFPKTLAKGDESFSTFKGTNQLLFNHLLDKMNGVYGIIPMDFPEYPNDSLIPLIISTNHF